jgi:periplasmic divalent cation tolerance protein
MEHCLVYITAQNLEQAESISRTLLEEKLIACVNIFPGITSLYWWKGEIQKDSEVALIAKSKQELAESIVNRVKSMHSYECPCIVFLPIIKGNPDFLSWITQETRSAGIG